VSLIGTLEKIDLSRLLERVEAHNKTGLLVIKPGGHWVELYFRAGRLMCIGPVRTQASLGERLLQEGIITAQSLQEVAQMLGEEQFRETRMALTLMDMGYVSHEELRSWASRKAIEVLQVLFAWSKGEIYFDDDVQPPPDRLLVALSISTLLTSMPAKQPEVAPSWPIGGAVTRDLNAPAAATSSPDVARYPTLMSASQFFDEAASQSVPSPSLVPVPPPSVPAPSVPAPAPSRVPVAPASPVVPSASTPESSFPHFDDAFDSVFGIGDDSLVAEPLAAELPASDVLPPQYVDTSFMRPDMIMMPMDLSAARDQNVQLQLTPEHWLLFTRIDGRTSLGAASYELQMQPDIICRLAGQLQALGLIQLSLPGQVSYDTPQEVVPGSQAQMYAEMNSGYMLPGYAATTPSPWSAALPSASSANQVSSSSSPSINAQSPWGNLPNAMPNMQGQSWGAPPPASQPLTTNGSIINSGVYVNTR